MLNATEIIGFVGAGLAGAAYVPQISHLIKGRCSAGISRTAFQLWLLASVLTTVHAVAIGAGVFIALGTIQIAATALIMRYAARYQDTPCPSLPARATQMGPDQTGTPPLSGGQLPTTPRSVHARGVLPVPLWPQ